MRQQEMFPNKGDIIHEMREKVMSKAREKGCECPICDQFVKIYKRKINSTMAQQIIEARRKFGSNIFHVGNLKSGPQTGGGDFAKLLYWSLIEEKPWEKGQMGKRTSGEWCLTQKGIDFCDGKIKLPEYALIYNGECMGFSEKQCTIQGCLGDKFDYNELMLGEKTKG